MIEVLSPEQAHRASAPLDHGHYEGRWIFSFAYSEPGHPHFGTLDVFSDDTLSPGASSPLTPRKDEELVTYCIDGEFRHFDDRGHDGVLKPGWVQHTTAGRGVCQSEINNPHDRPVRFIRMWFAPNEKGVEPHYEQKPVQRVQRTNRFLPLVSNTALGALKMNADAQVFSSFLEEGKSLQYALPESDGLFVYVLEGGPLEVNAKPIAAQGSAQIRGEPTVSLKALHDCELLMADVRL